MGSYLHGSLAAGAYHPPKSDVDLLFVVERPMDPALRERVSLTCVDAAAGRPTLGTIELSVLLREATASGAFPMGYQMQFGEDRVESVLSGTADYGPGSVDDRFPTCIRCVQETGVVLSGAPIDDVFAPVPGPVFRAAIESDQRWILEGDHILESPVYGVLNLCRGLWLDRRPGHTSTPSKVEAGLWASRQLPPGLRRVVHTALDAHRDPDWIAPDHRLTAGRVWDVEALERFRDAFVELLGQPRDGHPLRVSE